MATLLLLNLCVVSLIQLTSSQSTYDVIQQDNDVSSCERTDQVLNQLVTSVSQLLTAVSRMEMRISQLESEQIAVKGTHKLDIYLQWISKGLPHGRQ